MGDPQSAPWKGVSGSSSRVSQKSQAPGLKPRPSQLLPSLELPHPSGGPFRRPSPFSAQLLMPYCVDEDSEAWRGQKGNCQSWGPKPNPGAPTHLLLQEGLFSPSIHIHLWPRLQAPGGANRYILRSVLTLRLSNQAHGCPTPRSPLVLYFLGQHFQPPGLKTLPMARLISFLPPQKQRLPACPSLIPNPSTGPSLHHGASPHWFPPAQLPAWSQLSFWSLLLNMPDLTQNNSHLLLVQRTKSELSHRRNSFQYLNPALRSCWWSVSWYQLFGQQFGNMYQEKLVLS